jgi:hypothetical protein
MGLNCFVIMPFSADFDDVYATIKKSVEGALSTTNGRCFRLDEARPAGRITERLLGELNSASVCVADLTDNRPNVMWEVGYAMALGTQVIIVTQKMKELPFDLKDMQSHEYDRNRLSVTLEGPLKRMITDTLSARIESSAKSSAESALVGELLGEVRDLKTMVAEAVKSWNPGNLKRAEATTTQRSLKLLEGAWETDSSNLYAKIVRGDLIVPYCFMGDNEATGIYFGWKRSGEYWFARYAWLDRDISGFAFLKPDSVDSLRGAWWNDVPNTPSQPSVPPEKSGVPSVWKRAKRKSFPPWASRVLECVRKDGLNSYIGTPLTAAQKSRLRRR